MEQRITSGGRAYRSPSSDGILTPVLPWDGSRAAATTILPVVESGCHLRAKLVLTSVKDGFTAGGNSRGTRGGSITSRPHFMIPDGKVKRVKKVKFAPAKSANEDLRNAASRLRALDVPPEKVIAIIKEVYKLQEDDDTKSAGVFFVVVMMLAVLWMLWRINQY